uniref:Uncharacterized protein n=1 Tax=Salvator merianae TaxID=96440 RepID=A0A8D0BZM5_SALMN
TVGTFGPVSHPPSKKKTRSKYQTSLARLPQRTMWSTKKERSEENRKCWESPYAGPGDEKIFPLNHVCTKSHVRAQIQRSSNKDRKEEHKVTVTITNMLITCYHHARTHTHTHTHTC